MKRALIGLVVASGTAGAQQPAQQGRNCALYWENLPVTSYTVYSKQADGTTLVSIGGGFRARCRGTTIVIQSDSAQYPENARVMNLVGHAKYSEDSTSIDADIIRYTQTDQQVFAEGHVVLRNATGSVMTAERVRYYRANPAARRLSRAYAEGHPTILVRDSVQVPDSLAMNIRAKRIYMERDSLFYAADEVFIERSDVIARADSAEANVGKHTARLLRGSPRVDGRGKKKFSIEGQVIDLFGMKNRIDSVYALGKAVAVSDSLKLTADTLHLKTNGTQVDYVLAWSAGISRATAPDRDITGRRLELTMPGQRLRGLIAIGRARAESKPDSNVKTDDRDWIEGDSLTATFDETVPIDSQAPLKTLVARGNARSFHQFIDRPPGDSTVRVGALPTLNYVIGQRIEITFSKGAAQDLHVVGQIQGLNLNPTQTRPAPVRKHP